MYNCARWYCLTPSCTSLRPRATQFGDVLFMDFMTIYDDAGQAFTALIIVDEASLFCVAAPVRGFARRARKDD